MTHNDCVWFRENSAAQTALGRVRELANEWAAAGGAYRRHADLIRDAIDGESCDRAPRNYPAQRALLDDSLSNISPYPDVSSCDCGSC